MDFFNINTMKKKLIIISLLFIVSIVSVLAGIPEPEIIDHSVDSDPIKIEMDEGETQEFDVGEDENYIYNWRLYKKPIEGAIKISHDSIFIFNPQVGDAGDYVLNLRVFEGENVAATELFEWNIKVNEIEYVNNNDDKSSENIETCEGGMGQNCDDVYSAVQKNERNSKKSSSSDESSKSNETITAMEIIQKENVSKNSIEDKIPKVTGQSINAPKEDNPGFLNNLFSKMYNFFKNF